MAHFAEIDENNVVLRILVVENTQEHRGQEFLANDLGLGGRWVQTSWSHSFRHHYAYVGGIYDEELDAFISPQPYPSWNLNKESCEWEAPIPKPDDLGNETHVWEESKQEWIPMGIFVLNPPV